MSTLDSGIGEIEISYSFIGANGCTGVVSQTFTVHDFPAVNLNLTDSIACVIETTHTLDGMSPSGGTFSGLAVSGTNFDPSLAGPGNHEITYHYVDANGCENQATDIIVVEGIPNPTLSLPLESMCEDETMTLSGGMPDGGEWSGPGVVDNEFDASIAGPGTHTINYNFTVSECVTTASDQITVFALPTLSLTLSQNEFCPDEQLVLDGASPSGGTWSGPGVSGNIFDASIAGEGNHDIVYTYTNSNDCTNEIIETITVFPQTTVSLELPVNEDCIDNTTYSWS